MTTIGKPAVIDTNDRKDQQENFTNHINSLHITMDGLFSQLKNLVDDMYQYDQNNESTFDAKSELETNINTMIQQCDTVQKNINRTHQHKDEECDETRIQSRRILEKFDYTINTMAILKNQIIATRLLGRKQSTAGRLGSNCGNADDSIRIFEKYHKKITNSIEHRTFSDIPKLIDECYMECMKSNCQSNDKPNKPHPPHSPYCECGERTFNYEFNIWETSCKYSNLL